MNSIKLGAVNIVPSSPQDPPASENTSDVPRFLRRNLDSPVVQVSDSKMTSNDDEDSGSSEGTIPLSQTKITKAGNKSKPQPIIKDLDDFSVEDLHWQEEEIRRKIEEKRKAQKRDVINQIMAAMDAHQITTEELVEALGGVKIKRRGVKAKPKYRDPETGAIWSGRGKEPAWIKGKDREPFLIDKDGAE